MVRLPRAIGMYTILPALSDAGWSTCDMGDVMSCLLRCQRTRHTVSRAHLAAGRGARPTGAASLAMKR